MIPEPKWLQSLSGDDRVERTHDFRCRLAALYRGPKVSTDRDLPIRQRFDPGSRLLLPGWVIAEPPGEAQRRAALHFFLRAAALYASPAGSLSQLATLCNYSPRGLSTYCAMKSGRAYLAPKLARAVELACNGVIKRRMLNPDVFDD